MAGKEIDPIRARSALAVIKQHPAMSLFVASPALVLAGVVWWLTNWFLGILTLLVLVGGGAYLMVRKR